MLPRFFTAALFGILALASNASLVSAAPSDDTIAVDPSPYRVSDPVAPTARDDGRGKARYLLLVSVDGLAHATLQRFLPRLPTLRRLAAIGFRRPLTTIFPSVTWASHVSAITGQYPRVHGILGNRWYQSGKGLVRPYLAQTSDLVRASRTPSLYDLAHARGWVTAGINWSGTQYSRTLTYNLPETMHSTQLPAKLLSPALRKIVRKLRWPHAKGRWKRSLRWPRRLGATMKREDLSSDRLSTELALKLLRLPRTKVPRLLMVHFVAGDTVQHARGTRSPKLFSTILAQDRMIADLLHAYRRAGLSDQTAVLVLADHGFTDVHRTMDLRLLLHREGISRYRRATGRYVAKERVYSVFNGHAAFVYVKNGDEKVAALIARLVKRPAYRSCVKAVYLPDQYARLGLPQPVDLAGEQRRPHRVNERHVYRHPGAPSLIVMSQPHCGFSSNHSFSVIRRTRWHYGIHGYLPTFRSLQAFLIGAGAGLTRKRGAIEKPARIVDVTPTAAHLLGLRWPKRSPGTDRSFTLDGRVLRDLLR